MALHGGVMEWLHFHLGQNKETTSILIHPYSNFASNDWGIIIDSMELLNEVIKIKTSFKICSFDTVNTVDI